jgi:hypothetical protein
MKTLGYFLHLISIAWLLTVGLHALAHLLQPLVGVPHVLRWFWHLPLPVSAMSSCSAWPMLLGAVGMVISAVLIAHGKRAEKKWMESSEA